MALVGRRRELDELDDLLGSTARGAGRLLVLVGPPGAGTTTLADAAVAAARRRGLTVLRAGPVAGLPGRLMGAQLLRDLGVPDTEAAGLLARPTPLDLDAAARRLTGGPRCLVVVDDVDAGGPEAVELLAVVASRVAGGAAAVLATAHTSLGIGPERHLTGLDEDDLGTLLDEGRPDVRHALWIAARGLPGRARALAAELNALAPGVDPLVHVALRTPSAAEFLDVDLALVDLLELAATRAGDDATRARVLARLAHELLGDASAGRRRRALADEARALADPTGDPDVRADVLDARLHALWDPEGAHDRLDTAAEIIDLARACGNQVRYRHGLFWRFVALMELGRVAEAESALAAFEQAARVAGDEEATVMALSRHAALAVLRGNFPEGARLADEVGARGRRIRLPDVERLVGTVRGTISGQTGEGDAATAIEQFRVLARRAPGHLFEATAARILAITGHMAEAAAELDRLLARALAASGPRWLGATTDLAAVAAVTGHVGAATVLYDALGPYRGRLVVWGGGAAVSGPVSYYLGLLASTLGRWDEAVAHLGDAVEFCVQIGAPPRRGVQRGGLGRRSPGPRASRRRRVRHRPGGPGASARRTAGHGATPGHDEPAERGVDAAPRG